MDTVIRTNRCVDIIVPFYRTPELVRTVFDSLDRVAEELVETGSRVVAVNDSPEDEALRKQLGQATAALSQKVECRTIENERNLGFVRSVNAAARQSVAGKHDVLLLNSDTIVFPGAIREMQSVAYSDPMIGFVSPRSNNATLCSLPVQEEFRQLHADEAYNAFRDISGYLPRFHFAPTAVGFCLFIKHEVLEEFGLFDEAYGTGYNEENDSIMRANRCGYRAAIANHAYVYHFSESSFSISAIPKNIHEEKNASLLNKRYPEYVPSVMRYFAGAHYEAEQLLTALLPDAYGRLDVVFDFSSVGPYYNGTFEAARHILVNAVKTWRQFNLYVMVSTEAMRFHKLDELERVFFVPLDTKRKFAVAFRFGQPFESEQVWRMSRIGFTNVYGMLDPIATDCMYLSSRETEHIWQAVFDHADGVIYISDFVAEQFRRRFRQRPGMSEMVAYLSLDYRDYSCKDSPDPLDDGHILVMGNAFAHKRVPATVDALARAFPREKIVAVGLQESGRHNVVSYTSGNLTEEQMEPLLRGARFVVFPSLYEGFGIPIVKSLAYGKPVLARQIPVTCAIRDKLGGDENLILYCSTDGLIRHLQQGFPKPNRERLWEGDPNGGWQAVSERIGTFLEQVVESASFSDILLPRLERFHLFKAAADAAATRKPSRVGASLGRIGNETDDRDSNSEGELLEPALTIRNLTLKLEDREAWIQKMYQSLSWQITSPLRALGDAYLRLTGQRRSKAATRVTDRLLCEKLLYHAFRISPRR